MRIQTRWMLRVLHLRRGGGRRRDGRYHVTAQIAGMRRHGIWKNSVLYSSTYTETHGRTHGVLPTWCIRTAVRSAVDATLVVTNARLMGHINVRHEAFVLLPLATFVPQGDRFVRHIFKLIEAQRLVSESTSEYKRLRNLTQPSSYTYITVLTRPVHHAIFHVHFRGLLAHSPSKKCLHVKCAQMR